MRNLDVHVQFADFFTSDGLKPYAYLVSRALANGHVCYPLADLPADIESLPLRYRQYLQRSETPIDQEPQVSEGLRRQPFVLHHSKLYLQRYFHYETLVLNRILAFLAAEAETLNLRKSLLTIHRSFLHSLFNKASDDLSAQRRVTSSESSKFHPAEPAPDWQKVAAISALMQNFTLITGGPGTGKTTTIKKILLLFYKLYPQGRVVLAAPTGKAAVRMTEAIHAAPEGLDSSMSDTIGALTATTIHSLLGPKHQSPYFKHDRTQPIMADLVIIDEASMVDMALFAKLLDAIGPSTQLILLGDRNQLASVEAGNLLSDLCHTQAVINSFSSSTADFIFSMVPKPQVPPTVSPQVPTSVTPQVPPSLSPQVPTSVTAQVPPIVSPHMPTSVTPLLIPEIYPLPTATETPEPNPLEGHIIELQLSRRFSDDRGIGKLSKAVIANDIQGLLTFIHHPADSEVVIDPHYSHAIFKDFILGYQRYIEEEQVLEALHQFNTLRVLCAVREGERGLVETNKQVEDFLRLRGILIPGPGFYHNRPVILTRNYPDLNLFNGDIGLTRTDPLGHLRVYFERRVGELHSVIPSYIVQAETAFAMTIHKSQGSEYNQVLVILPEQTGVRVLARELLYTAVTRAKTKVIVQASEEVMLLAASRKVKRASGLSERFTRRPLEN